MSIAPVIIEKLFPEKRSATLCAGIYARSWPSTASADHSEAGIARRLRGRPLEYWEGYIERSTLALLGSSSHGMGFCLVTPEGAALELSYLFVEPEAFGTGLAETLCEQAELTAERPLHAWVLEGNGRSRRFFTRRRWEELPDAGQPTWAGDGDGVYTLFRYTPPAPPPKRVG